ncbi:MAG: o-succinylbenzoate synthase [Acidobacteria bacterium]|nr:o-succinylbenzoate synthase [Acidobacteriota bacterium]MBI3658122.1 o-succinylbenzoate synthase [Acidobacteriota bacterium]
MRIERIELREIRLPLVHFFETSFHRLYDRRIVLTRVFSEGFIGFGEATAAADPYYSYETADTAWHIIKDFIAPELFKRPVEQAAAVAERLARIRGHNMAKAAVEIALWDLEARMKGLPLYQWLGGVRREIPCGVSIGIQDSVEQLLDKIRTEIDAGYRRIKIKIKPGWDVEVIRRVREVFPDILLMADANSAYTLSDIDLLRRLDQFNLMMIEQPLAYDDILDHAKLVRELATPICLDESILNTDTARKAIEYGCCKIINVKLGRVGGFAEAQRMQAYCAAAGVPVWCGGMLESGIGRAHNIALSTLPGFTLPGDVSASRRYFHRDVIVPPVVVRPDGFIPVSQSPGLGYEPDLEFINQVTVRCETLASLDFPVRN